MEAAQRLGRLGADRGQAKMAHGTQIEPLSEQALEERADTVGAREDEPVVGTQARQSGIDRSPVARVRDLDRRQHVRHSAERDDSGREIVGLMTWPGDHDPATEEWQALEPAPVW